MAFLHSLHVGLAYLTVIGFVMRAVWAVSGSPMLQRKIVRVLPHAIDTLLLIMGLTLVFTIGHPLTSAPAKPSIRSSTRLALKVSTPKPI